MLFFGDLPRARVVTIGINPSRREYLSGDGVELEGAARRFETLRSLGAMSRSGLTTEQSDRAISTMREYFSPDRPVYHWFAALARVMDGFGNPFAAGRAAHLDLVQEATDPVWSGLRGLDRGAADALLVRDLDFLEWQIGAFDIHTLVCTSAAVMKHVFQLVDAKPVREGKVALLRWTVATGRANGRELAVVGWNIPLARPTGLNAAGQHELGALLRDELAACGS